MFDAQCSAAVPLRKVHHSPPQNAVSSGYHHVVRTSLRHDCTSHCSCLSVAPFTMACSAWCRLKSTCPKRFATLTQSSTRGHGHGALNVYFSYLPGRGDTMIKKVVHPGRGSTIANSPNVGISTA